MTWAQDRAIRLIRVYQRAGAAAGRLSPCRFTPSCSVYSVEAFEVYGTARGLWLTIRRLLRCRPFGPSGYDPVPLPEDDLAAPCVHDHDDHDVRFTPAGVSANVSTDTKDC